MYSSILNRSNKMKSTVLLIGGILQTLIVLLHIGGFFGVALDPNLNAHTKESLNIFNACVLTIVTFFAYVSLFRRRDLIETTLGRIVCGCIALFYLQRGIVGASLRGIDPVDIGPMLVIAALYIFTILPSKRKTETQ
jgi:hypothetical protein